jgi:hypothetical protein
VCVLCVLCVCCVCVCVCVCVLCCVCVVCVYRERGNISNLAEEDVRDDLVGAALAHRDEIKGETGREERERVRHNRVGDKEETYVSLFFSRQPVVLYVTLPA